MPYINLRFMLRFRPNMMDMQAADLYAYMRATSSFLRDVNNASLLANLKGFIVEQSEVTPAGGEGSSCTSSPAKSSFGGRAGSFSPHKKPKTFDTRPAALARTTWTITINRQARTVTIGSEISTFYFKWHILSCLGFCFCLHYISFLNLTT
jgi:hypothetical protein